MSEAAVSAWVEKTGEQQEIKWLGKTRLRVLADAARTGGQVTVIEEHCGAGDASPLHIHHHEDEMFWLLEGAMTAWVGDARLEIDAGGFVFLPRGIPHAYRFTVEHSRALLVATPAGIEDMFRDAGWDLATPPPPEWSVSLPLLGRSASGEGHRSWVLPLPIRSINVPASRCADLGPGTSEEAKLRMLDAFDDRRAAPQVVGLRVGVDGDFYPDLSGHIRTNATDSSPGDTSRDPAGDLASAQRSHEVVDPDEAGE